MFNREELIKQLEAVIYKTHQKRVSEWRDKKLRTYDEQMIEWNDVRPSLIADLEELLDKVKMNRISGYPNAFFSKWNWHGRLWPIAKPQCPSGDDEDFMPKTKQFVRVLKMMDCEKVSTSTLADMGYRNLKWYFEGER